MTLVDIEEGGIMSESANVVWTPIEELHFTLYEDNSSEAEKIANKLNGLNADFAVVPCEVIALGVRYKSGMSLFLGTNGAIIDFFSRYE